VPDRVRRCDESFTAGRTQSERQHVGGTVKVPIIAVQAPHRRIAGDQQANLDRTSDAFRIEYGLDSLTQPAAVKQRPVFRGD